MRLHRNPGTRLLGALAFTIATLLAGCGTHPIDGKLSGFNQPSSEIAEASKRKKQGERSARTFVTIAGEVTETLPDDLQGSKHQLFIVEVAFEDKVKKVRCAHNIDLAPKVPLAVGDEVEIRGVYINEKPTDVIHWTHHDPRGGNGGWIVLDGKKYE